MQKVCLPCIHSEGVKKKNQLRKCQKRSKKGVDKKYPEWQPSSRLKEGSPFVNIRAFKKQLEIDFTDLKTAYNSWDQKNSNNRKTTTKTTKRKTEKGKQKIQETIQSSK